MESHVSDEVKQSATNCKKDFSCLKAGRNDLCQVKYCVGGKLHFIKCLNQEYCSYQHAFGDEFFCSCPVRKELYNRYGI